MMITETSSGVVLANGGGKIRRTSFKSRSGSGVGGGGGGGGSGSGSGKGYRAVRVTVPSTMVAELASKFNAVVVDANRGATTRDIIKKVNKTLATRAAGQSGGVRATVEKFESVVEKKQHGGGNRNNMVVRVRTDSDRRRSSAEQRPPSPASSSVVKRRAEQFQFGKKPSSKPKVLGPKPNVANLRRDERRLLVLKRLSVARDPDARLESVLNATTPPETEQQRPSETEQQRPPPETEQQRPSETEQQRPPSETEQQRPPSETEQQRPPSETEQRPPSETEQQRPPSEIRPKPNSSFLHGRKRPTTTDGLGKPGDDNHAGGAIYEELCDVQLMSSDPLPLPDVVLESSYYDDDDGGGTAADHHHYTTIDGSGDGGGGGEQNIYDDVVLASAATAAAAAATTQKTRKRPADEDGSYETVQPPPPHSMTAAHVPAVIAVVVSPPATVSDDRDDYDAGRLQKKQLSDSSLEIENSIYGMNPPSESTSSSGVTSDSVSASRNGKFELDDEWVDVADNTSDEFQEIILFRQKSKISDTTTHGWSIQVQKQLTKSYVSISSHSAISFVKDVPEQLNRSRINPCDSLSERLLLSVVLKTVFLEEKFESQELSLFVDNEINEKKNIVGQEVPEEIYADYDSFDSDDSWDDCYKNGEKLNRVPYPCENRDLPAPPSQQNVYGLVPLVKRAGNRMKKRWSLGSLGLSRIRKFSGNLTTDFGNRTYESTSDRCVEKKFNPSAKSLSSSIFYLNDPIYNNMKNGQVLCAPVRNASKPPSSIDSRRLSVARPSSPPPPPPAAVKRHSTGTNAYGSLPRSICNSKGRPVTNAESISENGSNQGSDLYMRFADEPLYQFYAADLSERTKSVFAGDMMEECDGYEEISSITSRPSALELITPCPTGHGQHRSLWCEVPEVKNSGIIDALSPRERKLQEAKFELITSEASYFKSLTVLEKHFVNSHSMNDETILSKNDRKILFGNVNPVRKCSEKLLAALEKCWQDNILLKGLCEILYTHSKENFEIFVKYCSNQIYIDRTLKSLKEKNLKFNEALQRLESDSKCQSLSLHSFLMLPMQRITRLPLLVDAILSQMDSAENSLEYQMCELTLASLNSIVQNCNESTRKLERYEEMLLLSRQLEFSSKREMKAMSVASSSRWLVRSGSMLHLTSPDAKLTFSRKLIRPTKLYFFLFNDMFFIAKRKSDENYTVVDYCARNFVQMVDATELVITSSYKNLLMLTILENHEAKTIEMLLSCDSESSKKRWIEAMSPPISSNPDETLYNEWDCPQVFAEHPYVAVQPDELSLQTGDIVKVLTKMNDGWYHGERIRDGVKGWFPGNYSSEIASQHARSKNLKQRYRLLAMSGSYLQSQQDKIKKK